MKNKWLYSVVLFYLAAIYWSCSGNEHKSSMERIKASDKEISYEQNSLRHAEGMDLVWAELEDVDSAFLLPGRSTAIKSFPCSNCHSKSLESLKKEVTSLKKAHWDIDLVHAPQKVMNCATCHDMDKPDKLKSLVENEVSFDHSYQVCGQCHSTQYKDWKGAAHGKRLAGWMPPRISQTCVGCHNPHKPAFDTRWPSRLNTKKLELNEAH